MTPILGFGLIGGGGGGLFEAAALELSAAEYAGGGCVWLLYTDEDLPKPLGDLMSDPLGDSSPDFCDCFLRTCAPNLPLETIKFLFRIKLMAEFIVLELTRC